MTGPRVKRQEEVATERRRRDDGTLDRVHNRRLALPVEFQDDKDHTYRWVDDNEARIHQLTVKDDWDICTAKGEGNVRMPVGRDKDGKPQTQVLVRKKMAFHLDDQRKKEVARKAQEQGMLSAPIADPNNPAAAKTYVRPDSAISPTKTGLFVP